ncbi:hypothetical protein EJ110_NYTH19781 [Nymphaea thermarum]|nr:hypothetical protein EJ110_NYTH19781 [Nymphaea thermarum]
MEHARATFRPNTNKGMSIMAHTCSILVHGTSLGHKGNHKAFRTRWLPGEEPFSALLEVEGRTLRQGRPGSAMVVLRKHN